MAIQLSYNSSQIETLLGKAASALQSGDIDSTLAVSGKAADAAAVGTALQGKLSTGDIDSTLSVSGKAADAKAVGDAIGSGSSLSSEAKIALLACFEHVAWTDADGQDYYDALESALYDTTWTVTNTLTNCYSTNGATEVAKGKPYSATIAANAGYTLAGAPVSITMGGTDITATAYSGGVISIAAVTGNLVITVTAAAKTLSSISAAYTQSGAVYVDTPLDTLKNSLVVTANYNDSSTDVIPASGYTLSGTLSVGTSTITVTASGKTATFSVTVTAILYAFDSLAANGDYQQYVVSGNHFKITGSRRNYNSDFQFDRGNTPGNTTQRNSWTTPMFSIAEGAVQTMKLKNVRITCDRAAYFNVSLRRYETYDDKTVSVGFMNSAGTGITCNAGTTTQDLVEISAESPLDATAHYFSVYTSNSSAQTQNYTIEFDMELYIDGVRYV